MTPPPHQDAIEGQSQELSVPGDNVSGVGKVTPISRVKPKVMEFFAGIGLARLGLEEAGFHVCWANDYEPAKHTMYAAHFGESSSHTFRLSDIAQVHGSDLPKDASLAWASSPCTDLSLAGGRAGLAGAQSGTFWEFTRLLRELGRDRPEVVVLENVTGLATSHGGDDLTAAIGGFNQLGYSVDVLALDARRFVPQSRPRMFVVGALNPPADTVRPSELRPDYLNWVFSDDRLVTHRAHLPAPPPSLVRGFSDMIEEMPTDDDRWWDAQRTNAFVDSLSPIQYARVEGLRRRKKVCYRTAYRRTRGGVAMWEVRPDDIAGCLRTARGGSSKQAVVRLGANKIQVRWMTPREYARLMGAGAYNLQASRTNQALFGFGDAVAVPVVEWLGTNYLMPLLRGELADPPVDLDLMARVR